MSAQSVQPSAWSPAQPSLRNVAPSLDADAFRESFAPPASSYPSAASESAPARLWEGIQSWLAFFRGLTLAAGSALSCGVSAAGLALLLFLAVTLTFAPATDTFSRRLEMDYVGGDLVGEAAFLPAAATADGLPPSDVQRDARFLAPGQAVDVWGELEVAGEAGRGVAQVVAQLTSLDGRPAAKASRALVLRSSPWAPSSLALAPLRWLGLVRESRRVRLPLFSGYREKRDVPFMAARLAVKARNPRNGAAEVLSATLHVRLRLGLVRRLLYTLRPGPLALLLLGGSALAAFLGGGAAALLLLAALLYAGLGAAREGGTAVAADEASSNQSEAAELSSADDVSEASSSLLREAEAEGEPPSPRLHRLDTAAAQQGPAPQAGPSRKPGGLADSAWGSDAGLPGGAGALRRRGGNPKP